MFLGVLNFGLVLFPKNSFFFFFSKKECFNKDYFVPQKHFDANGLPTLSLKITFDGKTHHIIFFLIHLETQCPNFNIEMGQGVVPSNLQPTTPLRILNLTFRRWEGFKAEWASRMAQW